MTIDRVAFLRELLSIPSPSGQEDQVGDYLVRQMTALGFHAHRDEVGNAVGIIGDPAAQRTLVLLGHMDTVPGLIPVHEEDGRLYGRGAVDAKGPLAAFVLAAARMAPNLEGVRVVVIGAVEEEGCSRGARHAARTLPPPYCTIVGEPSGWEGITLGYKGILSFDYRLQQESGHSAGAFPGPAEHAVTLWNDLRTYAAQRNDGRFGRFDTLDPALRVFRTSGDGLKDEVEMKVAVRLPPGMQISDLQQQIKTWCNGAQVRFHDSDPAFQADKNAPPVRALLRAIRAEGGQPRFKLKTGTADMNIVAPIWNCPIVAYGPGDSILDHTPHEHIQIDEYLKAMDVLARALETLTGGQVPATEETD